ncbi:MAG: hypothetical protein L0229_08880 [Blastocatellia bacterium]|nr:hypothetical protein [Blastocatellia bacterium]
MIRALPLTILFGLLISLPGGASKNLSADSNPFIQEPTERRASTDERAALKPEAISPYMIEWYIDINEDADLKRIWRALKLDTDEIPDRCYGGCEAETFNIEIEGLAPGRTVALKISFKEVFFHQYLIFRRENSDSTGVEKWLFIGNIDSRDQRYGLPTHRLETGDDRTWFVVRELWGRGSSVTAQGEKWYEIKERKLKHVLRYPVEGYTRPCYGNPGRSYKSILIRHGAVNGVYTVPVQYLVSYNISECDRGKDSLPLFTKAQKAYFVWSAEEERFILDKSQSDITKKELGSVYHIEEFSDEEFVEYNFSELSEIARSGDAERRDWLRQFLTRVQDSPRKTVLQQALQQ